jgi:hypothetical protein
LGEATQRCPIDLGVDRGRLGIMMAQHLTDFREGSTSVKHFGGSGMAQSMGTEHRQACPTASSSNDTADTGRVESLYGGKHGKEHVAARRPWPMMEIGA